MFRSFDGHKLGTTTFLVKDSSRNCLMLAQWKANNPRWQRRSPSGHCSSFCMFSSMVSTDAWQTGKGALLRVAIMMQFACVVQ
jgi:hypothetical protein